MRILILHHPKGHPYWQEGEFKIELPNGGIYDKRQHSAGIPTYAEKDPEYCSSHRIVVKEDGIYFQHCGASSGGGKQDYKQPFKIIDKSEYDKIEFAGTPLEMSETLLNDLAENLPGHAT